MKLPSIVVLHGLLFKTDLLHPNVLLFFISVENDRISLSLLPEAYQSSF